MDSGDRELAQGETGIIAIHGPQVMKGYWEGFFHISDRLKDMVIVGGLKAYPREIEDIFFEHPKVQMAAVIGLPLEDGTGGEYVKAFVVLRGGETATPDELIAWSADKMAAYKRPRELEIVDSLPLTAVGKVLRRELKEAEMAKRG
ncbi:MAG: AMP-binding enzyme [Candidatus Thorarchaeota archaeon]